MHVLVYLVLFRVLELDGDRGGGVLVIWGSDWLGWLLVDYSS